MRNEKKKRKKVERERMVLQEALGGENGRWTVQAEVPQVTPWAEAEVTARMEAEVPPFTAQWNERAARMTERVPPFTATELQMTTEEEERWHTRIAEMRERMRGINRTYDAVPAELDDLTPPED